MVALHSSREDCWGECLLGVGNSFSGLSGHRCCAGSHATAVLLKSGTRVLVGGVVSVMAGAGGTGRPGHGGEEPPGGVPRTRCF